VSPQHAACESRIHRFEVRNRPATGDPVADGVMRSARSLGVEPKAVRTARVYLIEASLDEGGLERVARGLLADPVLETVARGASPVPKSASIVEVHPLPGVMDPAALTVERAVRELTGVERVRAGTGVRYEFEGITADQADLLAKRLLANAVIEAVHREPWTPSAFPQAAPADQTLRHILITRLSDEELKRLSRDGHLFLSLDEMRGIQAYYREQGREPTDIELETLAQTWSEHCVHKTLKSTVVYRSDGDAADEIKWQGRPGHEVRPDGSVVIHNLLKSTVAAATHELIAAGVDWTLSVFKDNAGIVAFDDQHAVCIKVETHNHPSAIEPYGGAATGVGGCIRDVIGTGLGARPIANTDVFCVGFPDSFTTENTEDTESGVGVQDGNRIPAPNSDPSCSSVLSVPSGVKSLPPGCLHPKRVLTRVVEGVRDYGNRMGIPTLNGAVYFDDRYVGNPLVFCGCIGVMPRDRTHGSARVGDRIIAVGGRTGRDGIHGATFSSAELTHTHADEFSHAVQIGNAIEEKRTMDAILRARDHASGCLYSAITDCGAGGFSSAVGEMGAELGATVHLDRAPLKYEGLRYDEIWISESQERMVLAVPPEKVALLQTICDEEGAELADLGEFGTPKKDLILHFKGAEVGRLSMEFLHDGIPMPTREAVWRGSDEATKRPAAAGELRDEGPAKLGVRETLLRTLAHPNIASKRWIVRQYDHEVQGNTVIKPLVGPGGIGPGDASVIQPVPGSKMGLAIGCGLAVPVGDPAIGGDPYHMAIAAVDECVRNLVCVGADPGRIAILDNFCWPSCDKPENMASLVRAAEGCYDAAKAYRTPFVSGKDSLNNQFRYTDPATGKQVTIEIPPTLLITGIGIVPDVSKCVTMDLKAVEGSWLLLLRPHAGEERSPEVCSAIARVVHSMIAAGIVLAAHDVSDRGPLTAMAEMLIASGDDAAVGLRIETAEFSAAEYFEEYCGGYIVQVRDEHVSRVSEFVDRSDAVILNQAYHAYVDNPGVLRFESNWIHLSGRLDIPVSDLRTAFLGTLNW